MLKTLIASTLAGAIALGSAATPAAADNGDRTRTILGLSALAIIGAVIADNNKHKSHSAPPPVTRNDPPWVDDSRRRDDRWGDSRWGDGRGRDGRDRTGPVRGPNRIIRQRVLPGSCEFSIRTRNGVQQVLGKSCLLDQGYWRVPDNCEFRVRTGRGPRQVLGSDCVERNGYRIEARR